MDCTPCLSTCVGAGVKKEFQMKQLLPTILLVMLISACAPDPRKEAEAYATRIEADQNAIQPQWQLALNRAIWGGSISLIFGVCFSFVSVTRTFNQTVEGVGAAF